MRRLGGMSISPGEGRIQFTRLVVSCELSRLLPGGRNKPFEVPFSIRFSFLQDPVGRFSKMPGHRYDGLGMSSLLSKSHIKINNVAACPTLMEEDDRIRRLDKSPLEIAVYIRTDTAREDLVPARFDAGNGASIAGQPIRARTP